jgi:predicted outer membrane repeat protein
MNNSGILHVLNSTFTGNTVTCNGVILCSGNAAGGAIANFYMGTLTVTGSTFLGNSAQAGGAIFNSNSGASATVTNSTITGNSAWLGAGVYNTSTLIVTDSTIFGNSANGGANASPGGLYRGGIYNAGGQGSVTLANSIVSGNTTVQSGGTGSGTPHDIDAVSYSSTDQGGNLVGYANGSTVNTAAINLLPLGSYGGSTQTMLPQPGSPAICTGLSANLPGGVTTDQRGGPLPANCPTGYVDSGAVQSNYVLVNTLQDKQNSDTSSCTDGGSCSLRDLLAQIDYPVTMVDAAFAPSLFVSGNPSVATPGTITLGQGGTDTPLFGIFSTLNLIGPGANLLTISGNNDEYVGNIFDVDTDGSVSFYGMTIAHAYTSIYSQEGGSIFIDGGTVTVSNCVVTMNSASFGGQPAGGIWNEGTLAVNNSTISGNSSQDGVGGGICNIGTLTMSNSTVTGNSAFVSGGGISSTGSLTLTNTTVWGNTSYPYDGESVGGIDNVGTVTVSNSIVAGNSPNDVLNYGGTTNEAGPNMIGLPSGVDTPIIGSLADSPATASVPTMTPLPGATSLLCAGSSAYLPSGVITDERGFPMDPNCTPGTIDLGAVQTNYTGYITTGYNGAASQTISPSPTAEVLETNALTGAQDSVGGIPVTLTLVGYGTLSGTAAETTATTTVNNVTSNLAVYSGLSINAAGTGDSFTPSIGAYTPTANVSAGTFNIGAATGIQLVFTTPPATPLQEGNAEPVVVSEETAGGATVTTASDTITLTVINSSSNVVYSTSQAASSGVASFSVPDGTLPAAGTYIFTASVTGNNPITPASQPVAFTSLTLPPATLAGGTLATSYSAGINAATNGVGTVTYALASGSQLPAGLSLTAATGAITGTPEASGTFTFSIQATDSLSDTATQSYSITIAAATPTVGGISPTTATAGAVAFPLMVTGTNFTSESTVMWGTTALTTTYVSATQLTAQVTAALVATEGTASVTVVTPAPGGGTSGGSTFTVNALAPTVSGISPTSTSAGSTAFPLTVTGTNFTGTSTILWGTTALTTTYVSATQLTAQVTAPLVATIGSASVTVETPAPGGGTSNAYSFEIDTAGSTPPTFTTATVTVTAGTASTANYPVTLASSATNISVTCLNLPAAATCSYSSGALIVNTTASTPSGTYVITAVFTETLSGTASGLILLPFLLVPFAGAKRRRKAGMMLAGLVVLGLAAVIASGGCGGGGSGSGYTPPTPTTYTATSSGTVTLVVH